ncbi:hypothetical protein QBC40DRAFT_22589 [Triangularia verruculosa]|uniref:Uncharacterized protein n=1 Tax=Triangularia verruculosa TaxID=2587418 RepID=A0AAN6X7T8_9PEZI|nr:hypothetical protein QBC40DRAFT_22589 [Triangularia verruculosa]
MSSHHGYKYTTVVHQDPSRSTTYYSSSTSSSSHSSSHAPYSQSTAYNTMSHSTSSGAYGQEQFRSPYAKGYSVDVSRNGQNVVINHHRPNPSIDEPRVSDSRDAYATYPKESRSKESRRKDSRR